MAKLTIPRLRVLRAAQRGDLHHSVHGGYDWIDLNSPDCGRVTPTAQGAQRDGLIELLPRQHGDEHRGQPYKLTDAGEKALTEHDAKEKR
ncbi:hypothetical protein [Verrucosispora sp. WMMC514]|uniref:hypothetical protein n=1 Tax=Verrucosispora sp. WMMC514 TaxID=3015156 RepID=UPI00248B34AB|nr:hypothetical protein [Verrucosispora sp. WMMC514]WBB94142.1 hypothetical protein O7597_14935 [Verrucosispora sp. WMMC514]